MNLQFKNKYKLLAFSIILDAIGLIPFIDIVWAPLSGYIMTKLYKGEIGKYAGIITFIEEAIPGLDFIPTFTIMWFYTNVIKKTKPEDTIIEVDAE
ncbi:hypothetical protein Q4512_07795 [Oceanihabitans sp. 2_MG-2023]|uniref:hypothetical protein n=1 Tax=Oceanihabitans sp. 2_MG-2023 TaxID=3062661 RepID=UPI0026E29C74|nr:hypothetical protein [Oceanihabitans sp. 2_MG-2023]MDO6596815.1 hypothetical protein [Oceanihabitans sp. 2_MG-2023]